jgi:hypothetical protein
MTIVVDTIRPLPCRSHRGQREGTIILAIVPIVLVMQGLTDHLRRKVWCRQGRGRSSDRISGPEWPERAR